MSLQPWHWWDFRSNVCPLASLHYLWMFGLHPESNHSYHNTWKTSLLNRACLSLLIMSWLGPSVFLSRFPIHLCTNSPMVLHAGKKGKRHKYLFIFIFTFFIVQLQLPASPPTTSPTPAKSPSLPCFHPPPYFCPCVLHSSSWIPYSPLLLPPSLWLLSDCSYFQCLWFYFACFFLLLIMFQLKVRSYGISPSLPGLFHLA